MANINQTLQMAYELDKYFNLKIFFRSKIKKINKFEFAKKIIGKKIEFKITLKKYYKSLYFIYIFLYLFFKIRKKNYIYTRSPIIGLYSNLLGFKTIIELHEDRFSKHKVLDSLICLRLNKISKDKKICLIFISKSLKKLIEKKITIPLNYRVLHDSSTPPTDKLLNLNKSSKQLVFYSGKIDNDRSIDKIIYLALLNPDIKFLIVGGTLEQVDVYKNFVKKKNISNIKIYQYQSYKRVKYLQCRADILLAFWSKNVNTIEYCSPLKIFEYMQTGNKILVHDFEVLKEVLPKNTLIKKINPDIKIKDLNIIFKKFLMLKIDPTSKINLINHGNKFTYKKRAENIVKFYESFTN